MNFSRFFRLAICCLAISSFASPILVRGYDEPSFSSPPFNQDGIFLNKADRQTLLEALASIACNFQGDKSVDTDLIEKSLAVALTLDPFHGNARQAHEALTDGNVPDTTTFFDTRSAIAEALWSVASELLKAPVEPEERKLAPLLMELSLLTHPEPTAERILAYESLLRGKSSLWTGFVSLQPEVYDSNRRAANLRREARDIKKEEPEFFAAKPEPEAEPMVSEKKPAKPAPEIIPASIEESNRSIAGVLPADDTYLAGTLTIDIRAPRDDAEATRFRFLNERKVENYPILPIFPSDANSNTLLGVNNLGTDKTREFGISWQQGAIGEATFEPMIPLSGEEQNMRIRSAFRVVLALKSITDSRELNPSIGLLGDYERASNEVRPVENPAALLKKAQPLDLPYLLIPANALTPLLEAFATSEELELLFFSDLLAYESIEDAYEIITLPEFTPEMIEASQIFAEIETVSVRMPLPELARNIKVQERLESILELVPNHFSARAMLEFGRSALPEMNTNLSTIEKIDELIVPYLALRNERRADSNVLRNALEDTDLKLAEIRNDLPEETRSYHTTATDALEAAEIYLGLTNRTTSIAEQRLRELHALFDKLDAERDVLGLERLPSGN